MYQLKKEANPMMKRINITLSEVHLRRLKIMSKKTGIAVSDLIRRAVDEYWEKFERKAKRG
jgi:16S rRNA U516 pseudouridylate synthase RsuA-like enzyme